MNISDPSPSETADRDKFETATEARVAQFWAEVLQTPTVSVTDNFFELGGESLPALRVLASIHETFNVTISLGQFFEQPTIRAIAGLIDSQPRGLESQKSQTSAPLRLTMVQEAGLMNELMSQIKREPYAQNNLPIAFSIHGDLDQRALREAINDVVQRHELLRVGITPVATMGNLQTEGWANVKFWGGPVKPSRLGFKLVVHPDAPVPMSFVDLTSSDADSQEQETHDTIKTAISEPFNYALPPLLRAWLLRLSAQHHHLVFGVSHVVSDAWSAQVFREELLRFYAARLSNAPVSRPDLPIQYLEYAQKQYADAQEGRFGEALSYWQQQYEEFPGLVAADLSKSGNPFSSARSSAQRQSMLIPQGLWKEMQAYVRQNHLTLNTLYMGSVAASLHLATGREKFGLGTFFANRALPGTEHLIGLFANHFELGFAFPPGIRLSDVIQQTWQATAEASQFQDVPSLLFRKTFAQKRPTPVRCQMITTPTGTNHNWQWIPIRYAHPSSPLTFMGVVRESSMEIRLTYPSSIMSVTATQEALESVKTVLAMIVSKPDLPLEAVRDVKATNLTNS